MKYVLLAIFVLLATQPLQVTACDIHDGQSDDQSSVHSQHGSMHDDGTHAMDCCGDDLAETGNGCGSMDQCSTCPAGMAAVKPALLNVIFNSNSQAYLLSIEAPRYSFSSPPFRPPIS